MRQSFGNTAPVPGEGGGYPVEKCFVFSFALSPQSGGNCVILAKRQCNENLTHCRGKRWCFTVAAPAEYDLPNRKSKLGGWVLSYKCLVH